MRTGTRRRKHGQQSSDAAHPPSGGDAVDVHQDSWSPNIGRARRGQTTAIGVVLILTVAAISTGLIVGLGAEMLAATEQATDLARGEQAMSRLDSRAAMVGLGQTSAQTVTLGTSDQGVYRAAGDDGWIRVVHRNHSGSDDEVLYNASLGAVTYTNGDTTIAYQAGGVWRTGPQGTTMVSPPEFHYRESTLTLPVIRVVNDDVAQGATTATISRRDSVRGIFPDDATSYDSSTKPYQNPVVNGTVVVTVHSEFYRGWAEHFRTQTSGTVSVDHQAETASVELSPRGRSGPFSLSDLLDPDGIQIRSQSAGHSVTDFQVEFQESQGTVSNLYFTFHAERGPHRVELVVHIDGKTACNDGGVESGERLEVYYFYRNTESGVQHEWSNTSVTAASAPFWVECDGKTATVHVDFTSSLPLTYGDVSLDEQATYYDWGQSPASHADFNHSGEDGEPIRYFPDQAPSSADARTLTRHYVALLGESFRLRGTIGPGNRGGPQIDVGQSGGTFEYDTIEDAPSYTYIHVTETEVVVDFP